jgi:glycosyltransferase involved in cell wall biosynthesis
VPACRGRRADDPIATIVNSQVTPRRRVLVLLDYFLPGEKAGGPVRTLSALMHHLGDRLDFWIVTRNHDLGDLNPYAVATGRWIDCAGAHCRYLGRFDRAPWGVARVLRETPHDVLYLNGFFSIPFILTPLLLRRCRLVRGRPVIVAPRGQLDPRALALKAAKKRIYLAAVRRSRLFRGVTWQAANDGEAREIRHRFGADATVHVAPNLRIAPPPTSAVPSHEGSTRATPFPGASDSTGSLRVVFLSRISPMKNLLGAIEILSGAEASIDFDIYGTREDLAHWRRVEEALATLPANVRARYCGVVAGSEVHDTLRRYDLMLLPTLGESYGHAIAEALAAGCAPLISDRTPWRDLAARGVGWDLPLDDPDAFRSILDQCAREGAMERTARRVAAAGWMASIDSDPSRLDANAHLFGVAADRSVEPRPREP